MAITIFPRKESSALGYFGAGMGQGLGEGINDYLKLRLQRKLQSEKESHEREMQEKRMNDLSSLLQMRGYSPDQANLYARIAQSYPDLLKPLYESEGELPQLMDMPAREQQPVEQPSPAGLGRILGAEVPVPMDTLRREEAPPTLELSREGRVTPKVPSGIKNIIKLRRQILKDIKAKKYEPEDAAATLRERGYSDEEVKVLLATGLTDEIASYFLREAKGNIKKAKKLAKQSGFKL